MRIVSTESICSVCGEVSLNDFVMNSVDISAAKDAVSRAVMDWNLSDGLPYLSEHAVTELISVIGNYIQEAGDE